MANYFETVHLHKEFTLKYNNIEHKKHENLATTIKMTTTPTNYNNNNDNTNNVRILPTITT